MMKTCSFQFLLEWEYKLDKTYLLVVTKALRYVAFVNQLHYDSGIAQFVPQRNWPDNGRKLWIENTMFHSIFYWSEKIMEVTKCEEFLLNKLREYCLKEIKKAGLLLKTCARCLGEKIWVKFLDIFFWKNWVKIAISFQHLPNLCEFFAIPNFS